MAKGSFGERLKRERELREVTLEEITAATRIGPRFLEALENEEWDKLPGGVFNRGFVRSVARYLGLDEEVLIGEYDLAHGAPATPAPPPHERSFPSGSRWIPLLVFIGLLFLVLCVAVGGVYAWRHHAARRAQNHPMVDALAAVSPPPATTVDSPPTNKCKTFPQPRWHRLLICSSPQALPRAYALLPMASCFSKESSPPAKIATSAPPVNLW